MLNSKEFVRELQLRHESAWMNPNVGSAETALAALPLTRSVHQKGISRDRG